MIDNQPFDIGVKETREIIEFLQVKHGEDFSCWPLTQLSMRLNAVMDSHGFRRVPQLLRLLTEDVDGSKYQDFLHRLLVRSTELFRDPSLWRYLRDTVLPSLMKNRSQGAPLRFLICSNDSGEELYSLLIVLEELNLRKDSEVVECYLSERRRESVMQGLLGERMEDIESANFDRYRPGASLSDWVFTQGRERKVRGDLLTNVKYRKLGFTFDFTPEDGFFDLVLCRNHFLYFTPKRMVEQLESLHGNMRQDARLVVGVGENLVNSQISGKFTLENRDEKVYRRVRDAQCLDVEP